MQYLSSKRRILNCRLDTAQGLGENYPSRFSYGGKDRNVWMGIPRVEVYDMENRIWKMPKIALDSRLI